MISRSRPPEQLIIGPPQKAAEKQPAAPWSTGGADGVAGMAALGAERKLVATCVASGFAPSATFVDVLCGRSLALRIVRPDASCCSTGAMARVAGILPR